MARPPSDAARGWSLNLNDTAGALPAAIYSGTALRLPVPRADAPDFPVDLLVVGAGVLRWSRVERGHRSGAAHRAEQGGRSARRMGGSVLHHCRAGDSEDSVSS